MIRAIVGKAAILGAIALVSASALITACGSEESTPAATSLAAPAATAPAATAASAETSSAATSTAAAPSAPQSTGDSVAATEAPQTTPDSSTSESAEESTPRPAPTIAPKADGEMAPELVGTQAWVNSDPLTIGGLRGKVVLIDFWTYTCVNCIRTLPFLKVWHSKYADDGLVIIGVHTPEFEFEHSLANVQRAVEDYGIRWPVVQDNNFSTWRAFNNRYWPAKYLIDKDGVMRYQHFGEGAYAETEEKIQQLLMEAGVDLGALGSTVENSQNIDHTYRNTIGAEVTGELYGGYNRSCGLWIVYANSAIGNSEYCDSKDEIVFYNYPDNFRDHRLYMKGSWLANEESLQHGRNTFNYEDELTLRYSAKSVNVVLTPEQNEPFQVRLKLNGEYLTDDNKGEDVIIDETGVSYVLVDKPRLYALVEAPEYGTHELTMSSNSVDFAIYAFTFGVYESGI